MGVARSSPELQDPAAEARDAAPRQEPRAMPGDRVEPRAMVARTVVEAAMAQGGQARDRAAATRPQPAVADGTAPMRTPDLRTGAAAGAGATTGAIRQAYGPPGPAVASRTFATASPLENPVVAVRKGEDAPAARGLAGETGDYGAAQAAGGDRPVAPVGQVAPGAAPTRADTSAILRQIAEAMPKLADGGIDIRLNPKELGAVRMQILPGETGVIVHIQADRPETLDLLRRHIDQLAQDLQRSGHEAAGFRFGDGRHARDDQNRQGAPVAPSHHTQAEEPARVAPAPQSHRPSGGIDIRI